MNEVPKVPIGDFENTLSFPSEKTSLGSGLPSHLPTGDVPCPSSPSHGFLHTQLELPIMQHDSCHHGFEDAYEA